MKASELIKALTEAIQQRGDAEVVVCDGWDGEIFCADTITHDTTNDGRAVFHIGGTTSFDYGYPQPAPTPEQQRLTEAVAKTLTANSPFIECVKHGEFPPGMGDTKR